MLSAPRPRAVATGRDLRLNPLDPKLSTALRLDRERERALLLRMVLPVMLRRDLRPAERRALADAVAEAGSTADGPTLADVHAVHARGSRSDPADALGEYITGTRRYQLSGRGFWRSAPALPTRIRRRRPS